MVKSIEQLIGKNAAEKYENKLGLIGSLLHSRGFPFINMEQCTQRWQ